MRRSKLLDKPKRGRGRPRKIEDDAEGRRQVETMAGLGLTQAQICSIIGISQDTLARRFPDAFAVGKAKAIAQVAQSLFNRAIAGDNTAAIFYLKSQANWMDRQGVELSGANGTAIQNELTVRFIEPTRQHLKIENDSKS